MSVHALSVARQADDVERDFMASRAFQGAKPGFVFKTGAKGTGYYRDVVPGMICWLEARELLLAKERTWESRMCQRNRRRVANNRST